MTLKSHCCYLGGIPSMTQGTLEACFPKGDPAFCWIASNLKERIPTIWTPTDERPESTRYSINAPVNFGDLVEFIGGEAVAWRQSFFPNQIRWLINQQIISADGFLATDGQPNIFVVGGWLREVQTLLPLFVSYTSSGWAIWTNGPSDLNPGSGNSRVLGPGRGYVIF